MSASPKIFLTGGTGYIGGTVLDTLVKTHPEYSITVLLRKVPEGFEQRYPKVRIIKGTFDDTNLLSDIASESDIVIHGGKTKHVPSLQANIDGLLRRRSEHPGFLIRLAGTSIIADWQEGSNYGELNPKVWSDIDDIDEITSFPDSYQHRELDRILQEAAVKHGDRLKTAIICPPGIYGPGRGMGNVQSLLVPEFYRGIIEKGSPFYTQSGANRRGWVHIEDLMKIYLALVEDAVAGGKRAIWGKEVSMNLSPGAFQPFSITQLILNCRVTTLLSLKMHPSMKWPWKRAKLSHPWV